MSDEPTPSVENINEQLMKEPVRESEGETSYTLNTPPSSVGGRKYKRGSRKSRRGKNKFFKKYSKMSLKNRKRSFRRKSPIFGW